MASEDSVVKPKIQRRPRSSRGPRSIIVRTRVTPEEVVNFIRATQAREWERLESLLGANTGEQVVADLTKWMDAHGSLSDAPPRLQVLRAHAARRLLQSRTRPQPGIGRALRRQPSGTQAPTPHSPRHTKTLDVTLSANGIPLATLELKNPLTNQTAEDAIEQYRHDRDPRETLFEFKRRTLVHFAVDTEQVWVTTRLAGAATHFLPFNKGHDGRGGNPPDPEGRNYRTAYL